MPVICFCFQLCRVAISLNDCTDFRSEGGSKVLSANPSMVCSSAQRGGDYKTMKLLMPVFFSCFGIGIPILFVYMWRQSHTVGDISLRLGWLLGSYNKGNDFWEIWSTLRKLIAGGIYLGSRHMDYKVQVALNSMFVIVSGVFHFSRLPFICSRCEASGRHWSILRKKMKTSSHTRSSTNLSRGSGEFIPAHGCTPVAFKRFWLVDR